MQKTFRLILFLLIVSLISGGVVAQDSSNVLVMARSADTTGLDPVPDAPAALHFPRQVPATRQHRDKA